MRYNLLFLCLVACTSGATQMTGFGARYYDDITETYSDNHMTDKDLTPIIVVGSARYKFEVSTVESIAKNVGIKVHKDKLASWICLKSKDVNYWFISDNEMGNGDLTAISLAKDGTACTAYKGKLQLSINSPMLNASKEEIGTFFNNKPEKDIVMYYKDINKSDEYTQSNSIMYYLKNGKVQGVSISQGTTD
ncbi:hypothetical protein [Citrobacter farmeri]|uniref:hypothetical protein n=1 Tax=Citrobacter farmeri TaxID=67824 RepID=UPI0021AB9CCA|nr:hypothetical protein [Citrobacter farmeri]